MRMFTPFPVGKGQGEPGATENAPAEKSTKDVGLDELKEQIAAMQRKLDSLDK